MGRPILIDSDMLLYLAATNAEQEIEWEPDVWLLYCDAATARETYWNIVDQWCEQYGSTRDDVWHCFTERSAFRRRLSPEYKANRKQRKPMGYMALRKEIMQESQATIYHDIEADDMLSILAEIYREGKDQPIIASGDKDLRQVPGTHIWIRQTVKEIKADYDDPEGILAVHKNDHSNLETTQVRYEVSEAEAIRYQWMQAVLGDSADGVRGCPGIGEVKAIQWANSLPIQDPVECWKRTIQLYAKAASKSFWIDPAEEALLQTRLTRVLSASQYNFDTHEVTLWEPPKIS